MDSSEELRMQRELMKERWRYDANERSPRAWSHPSAPGAFYKLKDAYDVMRAMRKGKR